MGSHCSAIHVTGEQRDGHFHQYDMMMKWYLWIYHESFTMQNCMIKYQVYHESSVYNQFSGANQQSSPTKSQEDYASTQVTSQRILTDLAPWDRWNSWKSRRNNRRPWMKRRRGLIERSRWRIRAAVFHGGFWWLGGEKSSQWITLHEWLIDRLFMINNFIY